MALNIKANGATIKHMGRENFGMLMVIYLKDSGSKIKQMVGALIIM